MSDEIGHTIYGATTIAKIDEDGGTGRGPRGHRGEIRDRIRLEARSAFVEFGYDATTMRLIAGRVDCDPAMISYYFGSKQELFRECFNLPSDPAQEILALFLEGVDGVAERLLHHMFTLYEERVTSDTLRALMQSLMTDVATSQRFRDYIRSDILERVGDYLGSTAQVSEQIELIMAQMYGVVTMRYVVKLEPLASMPRDRLIAELAPAIQARIDKVAGQYL